MTKLEEDIKQVMIDERWSTLEKQTKAIAEVTKKYIEDFMVWYDKLPPQEIPKKINTGSTHRFVRYFTEDIVDEFLKSEGITE